ncbi:MAG: hypothetical protein ACK5LK_10315 [Chthoniobacterales bacterium]
MKINKTPATFLLTILVISCAFSLGQLRADKVTLKSGETLKGKVLNETSDQVLMSVIFSRGVREERNIPRASILSIEKTDPAVAEYRSITEIPIPENLVESDDLLSLITRYKRFIRRNPDFESLSEAQKTLEALEADTERLKAGDIKINHYWIKSEAAASQNYQVRAIEQWRRMNTLYKNAEIIPSLNAFAKLEKNYPGSTIYPQAVTEVQDVLSKLEATMNHQIRAFDYREAEREKIIKIESDSMAKSIREAREKEIAAAEARIERSIGPEDRFASYSPISKKSMEAVRDLCQQEIARLSQLDLAGMQSSLNATRKAAEFLDTDVLEDALSSVQQALIDWPENEAAKYLQSQIEAKLAAKAKAAAAAEAQKTDSDQPTEKETLPPATPSEKAN